MSSRCSPSPALLALGEHLAAIIIALMVAGGSALEEFAQARARRELAALLGRTPRVAHRQEADRVVDIPIDAVRPDDLLVIKPGEIVPVDGIVAAEAATLDEAALTGEPIPVTRAHGDTVRSGVVNAGGPFTLRASASAERSTYAAVVRLVQAAERERPPLVRLADRWALWFLLVTLAVGGRRMVARRRRGARAGSAGGGDALPADPRRAGGADLRGLARSASRHHRQGAWRAGTPGARAHRAVRQNRHADHRNAAPHRRGDAGRLRR